MLKTQQQLKEDENLNFKEYIEKYDLDISSISSDECSFDERLDSEYYKPFYLSIDKNIKLKNNKPLFKFGKFVVGPFGSAFKVANYDPNSNYRYIRGKDVKPFYIQDDDNVYMPKKDFLRLIKYEIKKDDLLISVVGTLGNVAIIRDEYPGIFSCKSTIFRMNSNDINAYYLLIFLNSKYGKNLLKRKERDAVQKGLNLDDLKTIKVPIPTKGFQNKFESLFEQSTSAKHQSKQLYQQTEQLLLSELNLLNYKPTTKNWSIREIIECLRQDRFDSEYWLPKYDEIMERIKGYKNGCNKLNDYVKDYSTGYPFSSKTYLEKSDLPLIKINNIKRSGLDLSGCAYLPNDSKNLSLKDQTKENDILISMSGTIGATCKVPKNINAMINQRILKLSVKDFEIEALVILLNSIVGNTQFNRIGTGGVQTNISSKDMFNILIPKISKSIQIEIAQKVKESKRLRKESKQLLEKAKRAVEIFIEENEDKAIEYLKI